jgi:hypothetical protein
MRKDEGKVMVEPLKERPEGTPVDTWLSQFSKGNNFNLPILQQRLTLNTLPCLRVRYRTTDADEDQMEYVYVVSGNKTFAVEFSADLGPDKAKGVPIEKLVNYAAYLKMVKTFRVTP